jgi:hypothetical protein
LAAIRKELAIGPYISVIDPRTGAPRGVTMSFDIVVGALHALVYSPDFASLIPSLIARAEAGDFAPPAALLVTTQCRSVDEHGPALRGDLCRRRANQRGRRQADADGARAPALAERNLAVCDGWPPRCCPRIFAPLTSDTPVLILGGLDPVTPPRREGVAEMPPTAGVIAAGMGISCRRTPALRLIEKFIDEAGFGTLPQSCLDYFATSCGRCRSRRLATAMICVDRFVALLGSAAKSLRSMA